ncbi:MAG: FAD-dependent oxidoreductase [Janthinobacterium lividum]
MGRPLLPRDGVPRRSPACHVITLPLDTNIGRIEHCSCITFSEPSQEEHDDHSGHHHRRRPRRAHLARVLHTLDIPATVYDSDASPDARTQGGQLDLHEEDGQRSLEIAGLTEQYRAIIHRGGGARRILDTHGNLLVELADDGSMTRPETLRGDIRRILLDSLPDETVQWGKKFVGATALGPGRHEVRFADGSTTISEILVGAEGTWSKVRSLLSDEQPVYAGMSYIDTCLHDVDEQHPTAAATVGEGALYALIPGQGFLTHREPGDTIHTYVILNRPLDWFVDLDFADVDATKTRLAAEFEGWAPELVALITDADAPTLRSIYELPSSHRWDRVPGVTLIGDAAHVTVPGGDGANLAMFDGAQLAQAIAAHPDDLETALTAYEQAMFPRSEAAAVAAHQTVSLIFGDGAPAGLLKVFSGLAARHS